jgi:lipopolysaccharide/colanic/teichoic acid biosynthesis glycosyltransferase
MSADVISAIVLFAVISMIRFGPAWRSVWASVGIDPWAAAALYAATWMTALWLLGMYRLRTRLTLRREVIDVVRAGVLLALISFGALFILKLPDVSRTFLLALFASQVVLTILSRLFIRTVLRSIRDRGYNVRYVMIVGTGPSARRFAQRIERHLELGLRVVGHLAEEPTPPAAATAEVGGRAAVASPAAIAGPAAIAADPTPRLVAGRPILGSIGAIERVLDDHVVDEVAICLPAEAIGLVEPITRLCEETGRVVRIPLDDYSLSLPGGTVEEFAGSPILSLVYGPDREISLVAKRLIDLVGATIGLVLLSPLLLAIAGWIRVRDGAPILFHQTRVGLHGRPFEVVKYRSMVRDAEDQLADLEDLNEISGHAFKVTEDPRISRTGRFLRASSLDELPQLWNVIRGEMSIVGPRPPLPREVTGYDLWHRRRLSMKPGITGLWQVSARRDEDFDRWVELDLAYIDRWSLWLDLKIMLRTVPAMIQGR